MMGIILILIILAGGRVYSLDPNYVPEPNFCLNFDGVSDYLRVFDANTAPIQISPAYTFEAWFKSGPVISYPRVILTTWEWNGSQLTGNTYIHIEIRTDGRLRYLHRNPPNQTSPAEVLSAGLTRYDDNRWHHVAVVYGDDGTGGTNPTKIMRMYVDGSLSNTGTHPTPIQNAGANFYIGANGDPGGAFSGPSNWRRFLHLIDEVRIWNYARTAAEIQTDFCKELTPPVTGLVHYYKFNEGTGTVAHDSVGNKHATFVGNSPGQTGPEWFFPGFPIGMCGYNYNPTTADAVLWYDPQNMDGNLNVTIVNNGNVAQWNDLTSITEHATQADPDRQPIYRATGINGYPAVEFQAARNYVTGHGWGKDDVMGSRYDAEITSGEPNIMAMTDPNWTDAVSKTLFVVFRTPSDIATVGRQVLVEFGETTTGFNVYIDNGSLCFGMWNRLERMFIKTSNVPSLHDIYDLAPNTVYLAMLEYNAATKKFRGIMSRSAGETFSPFTNVSPNIIFSGLTKDPDDGDNIPSTGIAGEVKGTRFHDYNIRTDNYAHTYNGLIGDVILYNNVFDYNSVDNIIQYLNFKYASSFNYPAPGSFPQPKNGDWKVFSEVETVGAKAMLSSIRPNPFSGKAWLTLSLPEKQDVRVELFDALGNLAATIYHGVMPAGPTELAIDAADLPPGVYLVKATGIGFTETAKAVLIK